MPENVIKFNVFLNLLETFENLNKGAHVYIVAKELDMSIPFKKEKEISPFTSKSPKEVKNYFLLYGKYSENVILENNNCYF